MGLYKILDNGVKIFIDDSENLLYKDIFIIIRDFGYYSDDMYGIYGFHHFLEHLLLNKNNSIDYLYDFNGSTSINEMTFYYNRINRKLDPFDSVKELVECFFDNDGLRYSSKNHFKDFQSKLTRIRSELENEYYYRKSSNIGFVPMFYFHSNRLYNGGRNFDFENIDKLQDSIIDTMNNINPSDIYIHLFKINNKILELLEKTFGSITNKKIYKKNIYEKKIELGEPNDKNSFIYMGLSNFYSLIFRFDKNIDYYLKLLYLLKIYYLPYSYIYTLGSNLFIEIRFENKNEMNNFIQCLFYFNGDILNNYIKKINNNYYYNEEKALYRTLCDKYFEFDVFYNETKDSFLPKYKKDLINLFESLKEKLTDYGYFFIIEPKNKFLSNKIDKNLDYFFITETKFNFNKRNNLIGSDLFKNDIALNIYKKNNDFMKLYNNKNHLDKKYNIFKISGKNYMNYVYILSLLNNYDIKLFVKPNLSLLYFNKLNLNKEELRNKIKIIYNKIYEFGYNIDLWENIFHYYFFDPYFSCNIYRIINLLTEKKILQMPEEDYDTEYNLDIIEIIEDKIYKIKTDYNFIALHFSLDENTRYTIEVMKNLMNKLKYMGLIYTLNLKIIEDKYYLFIPTVQPIVCYNQINDYFKSLYNNIKIVYIISEESNELNLDSICNKFVYYKV